MVRAFRDALDLICEGPLGHFVARDQPQLASSDGLWAASGRQHGRYFHFQRAGGEVVGLVLFCVDEPK